ncbi:MAG: nitrate reductase [Desulfobulbaceae bacterium A2]|nr:MAG: nitrate reductase [Desulfobulbaceae bacterium A2]
MAGPSPAGRRRITPWRLTCLALAFVLIAVNPVLNAHWNINFVQGWYQSLGIGRLWFVSPLEGLESLLVTRMVSLPAIIGMLVPVSVAVLLGRFFCAWACPINFFGEMLDRLRRRVSRKESIRDRLVLARELLWFALVGELLLSMILGAPVFVFLSPPGLVGRELMMAVFFRTLAIEGVIILVVLALELLCRRCYCRYLCPLGGLLALLGGRRRLRVEQQVASCVQCGRCDQSCPLGLRPSIGEAQTLSCWNCGTCVDTCPTGALAFSWRVSR